MMDIVQIEVIFVKLHFLVFYIFKYLFLVQDQKIWLTQNYATTILKILKNGVRNLKEMDVGNVGYFVPRKLKFFLFYSI